MSQLEGMEYGGWPPLLGEYPEPEGPDEWQPDLYDCWQCADGEGLPPGASCAYCGLDMDLDLDYDESEVTSEKEDLPW